jgi:hypothetical protein
MAGAEAGADEILAGHRPDVVKIAQALRAVVLEALPEEASELPAGGPREARFRAWRGAVVCTAGEIPLDTLRGLLDEAYALGPNGADRTLDNGRYGDLASARQR